MSPRGAVGLGLALLASVALGVALGRSAAPDAVSEAGPPSAARSTSPTPSPTLDAIATAGSLELYVDERADLKVTGSACRGTGPHADINEQTQAVMSDQDGTVIEAPILGQGELLTSTENTPICRFRFTYIEIPADVRNVTVEIGRRGKVAFSREQLITAGVVMQIGQTT